MDIGNCAMASGSCSNSLESIEPLSLPSINDDCKMRIFEYLEVPDLINIAETSKQLHTAVHDVFERKYSKGQLIINSSHQSYYM